MPNTKVVRSVKSSGMNKNDGGIPSQGYSGRNTTFTHPAVNLTAKDGAQPDQVDTNIADDAPINIQYREKLPTTIEPLGSVNLSPVNGRGQKS